MLSACKGERHFYKQNQVYARMLSRNSIAWVRVTNGQLDECKLAAETTPPPLPMKTDEEFKIQIELTVD